jgi:hypothetical protein
MDWFAPRKKGDGPWKRIRAAMGTMDLLSVMVRSGAVRAAVSFARMEVGWRNASDKNHSASEGSIVSLLRPGLLCQRARDPLLGMRRRANGM